MNNIYDLEGNNNEWTVQAHKTKSNWNTREYRGAGFSGFANHGKYQPATIRSYGEPTRTDCNLSSRSTLYIDAN